MRCKLTCSTLMMLQITPAKWWMDTCEYKDTELFVSMHISFQVFSTTNWINKYSKKTLLPGQETVPAKQCGSRYGCYASRSDSLAGWANRGWPRDGLQSVRHSHGHPRPNASHHQGLGGKHLIVSNSACKTAFWCLTLNQPKHLLRAESNL